MFRTAMRQGNRAALLLVDSEAPVTSASPWLHLRQRPGDNWAVPPGANDDHCHLMVQCMEAWFLADRDGVAVYFGSGFRPGHFPSPGQAIEEIDKQDIYRMLAEATARCSPKGAYRKGQHSFDLLARIDTAKVLQVSAWARRFIEAVRRESDA